MKATYSAILLAAVTFSATAQKAENDDMYFTAKDREKVKVVTVSASERSVQQESVQKADAALNPTDSYSARDVNPDYSSGKPGAPKADYFVEDYRPTGVNGNLNGNYSANSPNNQYSYYNNNPYSYNPYSSFGTGWGYPAGGMYSMGGMYPMDPYGMSSFGYPYSPYSYGSRMTMSYGMSFGYNPWMYNSMAYGYGSPWSSGMYGMYDPFMMSSMYCPYSFYGYNSGYSSYYPGTVVDNQNGRNVAYGRRSERSTSEQYQNNEARPAVAQTRTGRTTANGRTRSTEGTQAYYERGWKNNNNNTSTGSTERATRSFWSSPSQNTDSQPASSDGRWSNSGRTNDGSSWGTSSWDNNSNSGSNWNSGGNRSSWSGGSSSGISSGGGTRSSGHSGGTGTRGRD